MSPSIEIKRNVLTQSDFLPIASALKGEMIPWFYKNSSVYGDSEEQEEFFAHCFYNNHQIDSPFFDLLHPLFNAMNVKALIQVRANLELNKYKALPCPWHTDYDFDCKTALFYVNTCNGYTEFEHDEVQRVDCLENQLAIFDSCIKHRSWSQTDTKQRIVINFNYYD